VADSDGVWVSVPNSDSSVFHIDPVTNAILAGFRDCHEGIAVGAGATWLACATGLNRVDPTTSKILARIDVGPVEKVAVGAGSVWIRAGETIARVDPDTNRVIGSLEVGGTGELTFFAGALWYGDETKGLIRIRPSA